MRLTIITLLLFSLINPKNSHCQDFIQLTVSDGLPSNLVYGAMKDSEGYIWFFTDNGVAKYDGYDFRIFNRDDGIVNVDIWQIHEDKYKRKWLISSDNLGYYIENDSVKKIAIEQPQNYIQPQKIHYTEEGLIYKNLDGLIIIAGDNVFEIDKYGWKNEPDFNQRLQGLNLSKDIEEKIMQYLNNPEYDLDINLFLSQYSRGLEGNNYRFNTKGLSFKVDMYSAILELKKDDRIIELDMHEAGVEEIRAIRKIGNQLSIHHTKGHLKVDVEKEEFISHHLLSFVDYKLTRTIVDNQFLISGSFFDGAIISNPFPLIPKYLRSENINTIGYDGEDGILLITNNGGLYNYNSNNEISKKPTLSNKFLQKEHIIKSQKKSYLLYEQTIIDLSQNERIYQGRNDSLISDRDARTELYLNNPKDILVSDSTILILRYNTLFSIVKGRQKHNIISKLNLDKSCFESFNNQIFIGTNKGLFILLNDQIVRDPSVDSIPQINITDLLNVHNEKLAIISDNTKLHFWDKDNFVSIYEFDSPIVEMCTGGDYLYGLTADHLFRVNMSKDFEVQRFYFQAISGLGKILALESTTDTVFMGTESGFYKLHHQDLKPMTDLPKMIALNVQNSRGFLEGDDLQNISTSENNLKFNFKGLSIISLGNIEYSHRLLPSEAKWKNSKALEAEYTSLSAGDYTFEIYATDAFGNKSDIKKLHLKVITPWYESIKFYILVSLAFLGLISIFYWYRIKIIRKAEKRKTLMNQKIARYELQALRAQMNPHFIFNVLSSIQNAIRNQDVETADDHLYNFASLIRKFLEFSEKRFLKLQEEIDLIKLYTDIENLRFDPKIDIQFNIDPNIDSEDILIPSMLIQPIVENAINHGLFYKKDDRKLILLFELDNDNLVIVIEDNGIGRANSILKKKNRVTNHISKGLLNINNRIEILNQSEEVKIAYKIDDLKDDNDIAIGTRVRLLIVNHDVDSHNRR